jgi:hypothetical protein
MTPQGKAKCYSLLHAVMKSKGRGGDWDNDMRDLYSLILDKLEDDIGVRAVVETCVENEWPPAPSVIREHAYMLIDERNRARTASIPRGPTDEDLIKAGVLVPMPDEIKAKFRALGIGTKNRNIREDTDLKKIGEK